jgi:hypothetical protein
MEGKLVGTEYLDSYNQMRSEGAMRLGVGLLSPFFALAIGLALNSPAELWALVGGMESMIAPVLIVQGFYQYRKASSFIAHQVADGALLTPSMEDLKARGQASA